MVYAVGCHGTDIAMTDIELPACCAVVAGFSNMYTGQRLAAIENVVVVVINYRLGPFGK